MVENEEIFQNNIEYENNFEKEEIEKEKLAEEEIFEKDLIDEKQILPSFINEKYLKRKFKDSSKVLKEQLSDDLNNNKIIVKNKKLTIIEIDKTKKKENKVYESDDFTEVIKKLTKIVIKNDNFKFKLIKNMKNGIFIIESKDIVSY